MAVVKTAFELLVAAEHAPGGPKPCADRQDARAPPLPSELERLLRRLRLPYVWTAARPVIDGQAFDDLDEDVGLRPTGDEPEPLTVGDPAELHVVRSPSEELDLPGALVAERIPAGTDCGDVAVLVGVNKKRDDVLRSLDEAGVAIARLDHYEGEHSGGVLVGTFHRAKGLEFKEVFVPGMAAAEWPSRWFVPPGLDDEQRRSGSRCSCAPCSWACRAPATGWSVGAE